MPATPTLQGSRLRLRQLQAGEAALLAKIRAEPAVRQWWGEPQPDDCEPPGEEGDLLVIEVGGSVAGAIQYDEVTDPRYRSAGIDVFLGTAWQGRGLGREAIGVLVSYLFEVRGHHRLTIDPAAGNERAIRCYEAAGFARVGVMRQYERDDGGAWRDGLLMELLAGDWRARRVAGGDE
jgi:aminoglycoside 6'-N-acetyltransferase